MKGTCFLHVTLLVYCTHKVDLMRMLLHVGCISFVTDSCHQNISISEDVCTRTHRTCTDTSFMMVLHKINSRNLAELQCTVQYRTDTAEHCKISKDLTHEASDW